MVGQEQLESSPLCQHSDNETETKRECSVVIPDDWQLTSQQQAFIELFAEDDQSETIITILIITNFYGIKGLLINRITNSLSYTNHK